jgi:hypothetical protein
MRTTVFSRKLCAPLLLCALISLGASLSGPPAQAQASPQSRGTVGDTARFFQFQANPLLLSAAHRRASLVESIPFWSSIFAYNGITYPYQMVGTDPSADPAITQVRTEIIPLTLVFSNGTSFDGSTRVQSTLQSPLFTTASYTSGSTQYVDAIQRAQWWKYVANEDYHVLLEGPQVYPAVTINVPANVGSVAPNRHTHQPQGLIDLNWFDASIQGLITSLGLSPRTFPIFLTTNTFLYQGTTSSCCIIGYHNALPSTNAQGKTVIQTYTWGSYTDPGMFGAPIQDINALSHEIAEWASDPFTDNITPTWSVPSQPQYGCSNALEVGDPLVGVSFNVNGYHPQDEAFFSWFAKQVPSVGLQGQFTYLGKFSGPSPTC